MQHSRYFLREKIYIHFQQFKIYIHFHQFKIYIHFQQFIYPFSTIWEEKCAFYFSLLGLVVNTVQSRFNTLSPVNWKRQHWRLHQPTQTPEYHTHLIIATIIARIKIYTIWSELVMTNFMYYVIYLYFYNIINVRFSITFSIFQFIMTNLIISFWNSYHFVHL